MKNTILFLFLLLFLLLPAAFSEETPAVFESGKFQYVFLEDNTVKITCSEAVRIKLVTHTRHAQMAFAEKGAITEAQFDMSKWLKANQNNENAFLRLIVTSADGNYAVTRAYWKDELEG